MFIVGLVLIVLLILITFDFSFCVSLGVVLCMTLFVWLKWYCYLIADLDNFFVGWLGGCLCATVFGC